MRKLYGSTSWRRVLALVLVFVMMLSMMGTSGYSVFAEDLVETEEEVVAAPEEAVVEDITDTVLGESPGEDEEAPAEDAEAVEAVEEAEEAPAELSEEEAAEGEDAEAVEEAEEEAVEELGEDAEPAEEAEEAEPAEDAEEADLEEESEEEAEEPAEEAEEDLTLIAEAAQVIVEDDGAEAPAEEPAEEPAAEEEPAVEEPADPSLVADVVKQLEDGQVVEEEPVVEAIPEEAPIEEPEIAYPAVGFRDIIGGISVTVEAPEGAFPDGTKMKLAEVEIESIMDAVEAAVEGEIVKVKAVDITFLYEGEEIQPELPISVKMNASGMDADADRQVLHIDDEGEATVIEDADTSKKAVEFEADSFSVYVVVQTGEDARLVTVFHRADGTTETMMINKRQLDKIEQYIFDPGAGTPEDAFFKGWTTVEEYTAETTPVMTIEQIREDIADRLNVQGGIQDGTVVDYYAMAFHSYVISYLDEDGIAIKSDQILFPIGDTLTHKYTVETPYVPKYAYDTTSGASREFGGWQQISPQVDDLLIYQYGDQFDLSSDIVLRATINTGFWVIFDANLSNATFTGPVFAPFVNGQAGPPSSEPEDPTCPGYTFQGWYTGTPKGNGVVDNSVAFDFEAPLKATTTVYGVWTKNTEATYHVIIWQQSLEGGNNYDYKETITVNNYAVGNNTLPITATNNNSTAQIQISTTGNNNQRYRNINYTGFHVGSIDPQKAVEADNTTVINVYFARNEHTLTFRETQNGGTVYKTITALYGQNIKSNFPISVNGNTSYRWEPHNSSTFDQVLVYVDVMPDENVTFTRNSAQNGTTQKTIHYMIEALPNQTATRTYNGTGFVEYKAVEATYNFFTESEDYISLDGFIKGTDSSLSTKYQPQGYNNTDGNYPVNDPDYTGSDCWGSKNTMFDDGVNGRTRRHVFVYYIRQQYSIEYEDGTFFDLVWDNETQGPKAVPLEDQPTLQNISTKTGIKYELNINNDTYNFTPTKEEYVFAGWYKDVNCTTPYTFGTMPSNNFKLYAKWLAKVYNVRLVPNDSTSDPIQYVAEKQSEDFYVNCNEKIADMSGAERNYWELVGWYTDPEFTHSYDFAVIPVNDAYIAQYGDPKYRESDWPATYGQVTLYARWRSKLIGSDGIRIEYDVTDKGTGSAQDEKRYVDLAEAIAATAVAAADPDTYVFSHWNVQHWNGSEYEDSDVNVYPGEIYEVKVDDSKIVNTNTGAVVPRAQYNSLDPNGSYSYTVVLKAKFVEKDQEILTFINWYNNYDGGLVTKSENLKINQATPIPAAPTRDGYQFLGWIRGYEEDGTTTTLTDLWLTYDADEKAYYYNDKVATDVAADEHLVGDGTQHHALYAKWEALDEDYVVEYYYMNDDGTYPSEATSTSETRQDKTDAIVSVTTADKTPSSAKYVLDEADDYKADWSGTVKADGSLVLKVYFKLNQTDVTVEHYLLGTTTAFKTDTIEDQTVGSTYTATPETKYQEKDLTVNNYDPTQAITVQISGNVIKIYYTLPLTIAAKTDSKTYDGSALTGEYTITGALEADEAVIERALGTAPSITNVSESTLDYLTEEEQAEITGIPGYYVVTYTAGELEIEPATVTLTSGSKTRAYNGTALTNEEVEGKNANGLTVETGWIGNDGATYEFTGTITEEGSVKNEFSYTLKEGTIASNYTISKTEGDLTISKNSAEIVVTPGSGEKVYDGTPLTKTAHDDFSVTGVPEGFTWAATADGTVTNVTPGEGEKAENAVTSFIIYNAAGENVTDQFTSIDTSATGTLTILPAEVTLTSGSKTREYNGSALTNEEVEGKNDNGLTVETGWVGNDGATYEFTGTITEEGSVKNAFNYTLKEGTVAGNYTISKTEGDLTIGQSNAKITVTPGSGEKIYDGSALTKNAQTDFTVTGLPDGFTWAASADGTVTNVKPGEGEKAVNAITDFKIFKDGADVTAQFGSIDTSATGTLTINPREITLTSATDSKTYDGTELTNSNVEVSGDGFVEGEGATYAVDGSQTLVGSSKNTFSYTLKEGTKADNYSIETVFGTLTVTDGEGEDEEPVDPELVVTKADANAATAAAPKYALGDEVTFAITATNIYEEAKTITLSEIEGVTLAQSTFENVAGGATIETTATYTITEADLLAGSFTNTVTAKMDRIEKSADATVSTEEPAGSLSVEKETTSTPANGQTYALGEKITYKITVKNEGNVTITDIEVEDELTEDEWTIASLAPGESKDFEAEYTVTEDDIIAGSVKNEATAKGIDPEEEPTEGDDDTDDPTEEKNGHLTIEKVTTSETPEAGYALGDEITYKITVKNDGNLTITDITVTDELTEDEWTIESLAPGEDEEFETSYTVTEADILAGEVVNVATAAGTSPDPDEPDVPVTPGEDPEPTEGLDTTLSVKKVITNTPADGEAFKLGETIEYKITVKNEGNAVYTNVVVEDELLGKTGEEAWTIDELKIGESKEFTASYTVTEADIIAGSVTNKAVAEADPIDDPADPDKPQVPTGEDEITTGDEPEDPDDPPVPPIEEKNGHLTIEKVATSTPANGKTYALGEEISYKITVENDGNLTITKIEVTDELTGDKWEIASLAPGESKEFTAKYTVTEADILAGEVVNVATATGKDPEGNDPTVDPGKDPEPTEGLDTTLSVKKEITNAPADGEAFKLGETIEYKITVKNEGNAVYKNVVVEDELVGKTGEEAWTIAELKVGESKEFTASYTVTEDDILAGSVTNKAVAAADPIKDPANPDEPQVPTGEDEITTGDKPEDPDEPPVPPIEEKNGHLTITKETTSETPEGGYALGAEISYKITVKNDGNLTITDIKVSDELTGDEWTIQSLAPGKSEEFTAKYTVKQSDILAGEVVNEATATGKDPEGKDPEVDPGKDTEPTEDKDSSLKIDKIITSQPAEGEAYAIGEEITYKITVTNDGNVTIRDIKVTDELTGDEWTIQSLAPGKSEEFEASYTVTDKDTDGEIINKATATGKDPDDKDPTVDPGEVPAPTKKTVIYYTNYPVSGMENEWSEIFTVTPGYKAVSFDSLFEQMPNGYRFNGWRDQKSGKTYAVDDVLLAIQGAATGSAASSSEDGTTADDQANEVSHDADFVLYAQWTKIGKDKDPKPPVEEPDEPIEDPDTPLAPAEEEPDEPVDAPDGPFAPAEEEPDEEIAEEPTPFSPYTGDDRHTVVWSVISLLSLAGIAVVARKRKEEE